MLNHIWNVFLVDRIRKLDGNFKRTKTIQNVEINMDFRSKNWQPIFLSAPLRLWNEACDNFASTCQTNPMLRWHLSWTGMSIYSPPFKNNMNFIRRFVGDSIHIWKVAKKIWPVYWKWHWFRNQCHLIKFVY